ncbi:hypothetical protein LQZ13_03815 [Leuconostoc mesenteroides]|uniref:hypothetical protein n=1 Tax=Leuconostoc mesenteroides TaxID=1245 RepID=UPI002113CBE2|nr:hypothetical protein [Leuconostoc mesenteroides]UUE18564.1 hypothetical protein LQZ13_03815 [Leuconostoc mesenteroides]
MALARSEQETIVIFDVEVGKWHIDTTYPPYIRKYSEQMGEIEEKTEDRLSGWVSDDYSSSFMVKKRRKLSEEDKKKLADRLQNARLA